MSKKLKLAIWFSVVCCVITFVTVGALSGDWIAGAAAASALYVFVFGFPLMFLGSEE